MPFREEGESDLVDAVEILPEFYVDDEEKVAGYLFIYMKRPNPPPDSLSIKNWICRFSQNEGLVVPSLSHWVKEETNLNVVMDGEYTRVRVLTEEGKELV